MSTAASGAAQGAAQVPAPGPETPDTHSGVSERHGSDQASKSHWLKWDSGVRNIVGCQCGVDVDSDAGFGDSVVDHLIDVSRSLPVPSRGEGTDA